MAIFDYEGFVDTLEEYTSGGDVEEMVLEALNKLRDH
jgi:hypothetical protein